MRGVLAGLVAVAFATVLPAATSSHPAQACSGYIGWYEFSPTGHWIAYANEIPRGTVPNCRTIQELDVMRTDGTGRRRLVRGVFEFSWSPRTDLLAMSVYNPAGTENDLRILNPKGGRVRVRARSGEVRSWAWSPDGRWIGLVRSGQRLTEGGWPSAATQGVSLRSYSCIRMEPGSASLPRASGRRGRRVASGSPSIAGTETR